MVIGMTLDARQLKVNYRPKWPVAVKRELLVLNILNILLPGDYVALATGLGTGTSDYYDASYSNVLDAFDIVVYKRVRQGAGLRPVAYIDVTGFGSEKTAKKQNGRKALLCIGAWKLWKADEFEVVDRAWLVHVADKRVSLRWFPFSSFSLSERVRLVEGERIYYCLPQEKAGDVSTFLDWLTGQG